MVFYSPAMSFQLPILAVLYLGLLWVLDFRSGNGQWSELFHCVLSRSISSSGDSLLINDDVQENEDDDVREERLRVQHLIDQGPESAVDVKTS